MTIFVENKMRMKSICIIGQGNVATHLCVAFAGRVDELLSVNSRTLEDLPEDSDLYIIAVADDAIAEVAAKLKGLGGVIAHTSGSTPMSVLASDGGRYGVFYPLMTFSRDADIDYQRIPVFVEGSDASALEVLTEAARLFTDKVVEMDSARRLKMHVASVFACNFANALWEVAAELLREEDVPFRYMLPLIDAAAAKLHHLSPLEAQTGPARRGDLAVVERQAQSLDSQPQLQRIYRDLSQLIIDQSNSKITSQDVGD